MTIKVVAQWVVSSGYADNKKAGKVETIPVHSKVNMRKNFFYGLNSNTNGIPLAGNDVYVFDLAISGQ